MFEMVSVRDSAIAGFMSPFFAPTTGAAVRAFQDEVRREGSPMHAHPDDYVLFHIGTFDPESGAVRCLPAPVQLVRASDLGR